MEQWIITVGAICVSVIITAFTLYHTIGKEMAGMKKDIEHLQKENTCLPTHSERITRLETVWEVYFTNTGKNIVVSGESIRNVIKEGKE